MPTTDTISGATIPVNGDVADVVAHIATMNTTLDKITCPRFDNASSRNSKIPSPTVGQVAYLKQEMLFTYYDASLAWRVFSNGSTIQKAINETIVSSTVQQPDDQMYFYAQANSTYYATVTFKYTAGGGAGAFRTTVTVPAGPAVVSRSGFGMRYGGTNRNAEPAVCRWSNPGTSIGYGAESTTAAAWAEESIVITTGSTAGNVTWNWGQDVSDAAPLTVLLGTSMIVRKIS